MPRRERGGKTWVVISPVSRACLVRGACALLYSRSVASGKSRRPRQGGSHGRSGAGFTLGLDASRSGLLAVLALFLASSLLGSSWRQRGDVTPLPPLVIDPNNVRTEVLHALPRLGPTLVERVAAARAKKPFVDLDDLDARVKGIGPATVRALKPYLHIDPPTK